MDRALRNRVGGQRWYHTIDLGHGVATPGEYDLRAVARRLPWPDLSGARCLDVGSRDGFYAFEMERRGAREVVSLDLDDPDQIDFPGPRPPRELVQAELDAGNAAFETAREALGSKVARRHQSVYDLSAQDVGRFDFAVIGTLLIHLRDPVAALRAIRAVSDRLLVVEAVSPSLQIFGSTPSAEIAPVSGPFWLVPNPAGLRRWTVIAGFEIQASSRPFVVPWGAGRPDWGSVLRRPLRRLPRRMVLRRGSPHVWIDAA